MREIIAATAALAVIFASSSCKKEKAPDSAPTGNPYKRVDTAPLWKLVPTSSAAALVVSEGTLAHLQRGILRFVADFESAPRGATVLAEMNDDAPGLAIALKPEAEKQLGLDFSKGAAVYSLSADFESQLVVIVPIPNPAKARQLLGAKTENGIDNYGGGDAFCKQVESYYACSDKLAHLDTIGGGGGMKPPADQSLQGHIEIYVGGDLMRPVANELSLGDTRETRFATTIEPGGMTSRALTSMQVSPLARVDGTNRLLKDAAQLAPAGLVSVQAERWLPMLKETIPAETLTDKGPFDLTPEVLFDALDGTAALHALSGPLGGELHVGVKTLAPFEKLMTLCGGLPLPPEIDLKNKDGVCHFKISPPNMMTFEGTVELKDNTIKLAMGDTTKRNNAPALHRMGAEIASGKDLFAAWGAGSALAFDFSKLEVIPGFAKEMKDDRNGLALWFLLHLSEIGLTVRGDDKGLHTSLRIRTTWANSENVVNALEPIIAQVARGQWAAHAEATAMANQHPNEPLAADMKAGAGGIVAGMAGTLTAIAPWLIFEKRETKALDGPVGQEPQ